MRGQFDVIDEIYKYIPGAEEGKAHIDHIIDLCGVPPKGQHCHDVILDRNRHFLLHRHWIAKPERVYPMDADQAWFRAKEKAAILEANVQELHRALLLPRRFCNLR